MKRRKLLYAVCLSVTFTLNIFYDNAEIYLLFHMMAVMGIVTWVMYALSKIGLKLYCAQNSIVSNAKGSFPVTFRLNNRFPLRTAWCSLKGVSEMSNEGGEIQFKVGLSAFLNKAKDKTVLIPVQHYGVVNVYLEELDCRDFLGIFQKKYRYGYVRHTVVLPKLVYAEAVQPQNVLEEEDYRMTYQEVDSTEIIEFRNYRSGDPMHRIHWNLSAVSDDYIVKQYGEEIKHCAYILVDLDKRETEHFREELDWIYMAAYSVGNQYLLSGIRACFIAWDGTAKSIFEGEFADFDELNHCMAELMNIPCSDDSIDQMDAYIRTRNLQNYDTHHRMLLITASSIQTEMYEVFDVKEKLPEQLREKLFDMQKNIGR